MEAGERRVLNMNAFSRQQLVCVSTQGHCSVLETVLSNWTASLFILSTCINILVLVYLHRTTLGKFSFPCLSLPVKGYILSQSKNTTHLSHMIHEIVSLKTSIILLLCGSKRSPSHRFKSWSYTLTRDQNKTTTEQPKSTSVTADRSRR